MCFLGKYLYPANVGALGIPGGRPYYGKIFVVFTFESVDKILMVLSFKWDPFGKTFAKCYSFLRILQRGIWMFFTFCVYSFHRNCNTNKISLQSWNVVSVMSISTCKKSDNSYGQIQNAVWFSSQTRGVYYALVITCLFVSLLNFSL